MCRIDPDPDFESLGSIEPGGEDRSVDIDGLASDSVCDDGDSPDHHTGGFDPLESLRQVGESLKDLLAWPLCHGPGNSCGHGPRDGAPSLFAGEIEIHPVAAFCHGVLLDAEV